MIRWFWVIVGVPVVLALVCVLIQFTASLPHGYLRTFLISFEALSPTLIICYLIYLYFEN